MTTSLSRGISRSMFLRLWVRAPLTIIVSINHLTAARVKEETKHPIIRKSLAKSCQETCFCRQDRETGNRLASHSPLLIESPLFIRHHYPCKQTRFLLSDESSFPWQRCIHSVCSVCLCCCRSWRCTALTTVAVSRSFWGWRWEPLASVRSCCRFPEEFYLIVSAVSR